MEEKCLIHSEQYNVKKFFKISVIIGVLLSLILCFVVTSNYMESFDSSYEEYLKHQSQGYCGWIYEDGETCYVCRDIIDNPNKLSHVLSDAFEYGWHLIIIPVVAFTVIPGLIYLWLRSYELTVTDKRIYGKVAWGKRVDLPVDSVSATATIRILKGISVSTSSGRISFLLIKNAADIYDIMNNLLIERQQERTNTIVAAAAPKTDEADQLKKYKDLLDSGVITQEEFEAKKKQLLGL